MPNPVLCPDLDNTGFFNAVLDILIRLSFYTENYCSKDRLGRKYKCATRGIVQSTVA